MFLLIPLGGMIIIYGTEKKNLKLRNLGIIILLIGIGGSVWNI
jgi:hypothetical protein